MSDKKLSIVQKKGFNSSGDQHLTVVDKQYIIEQPTYSNLVETKIGGITFDPKSFREVIVSIDIASEELCSKQTDFSIIDIEEKNFINGLTQKYYDTFIAKNFEPYFYELDDFLSLRENEDIQNRISNIINTLNQKIFISRNEYDTFESLPLDIQVSLLDSQYEHLHNKENSIQFVLYYLYVNCYIGEKTSGENKK